MVNASYRLLLAGSGSLLAIAVLMSMGSAVHAASAPGSTMPRTVALASPLTTLAPLLGKLPTTVGAMDAIIVIPADAPDDLGVGAYLSDHDGHWFQVTDPDRLGPGTHDLHFSFAHPDRVVNEQGFAGWDGQTDQAAVRGGLFFWSAAASHCLITIGELTAQAQPDTEVAPETHPSACRILDLHLDGDDGSGVVHGRTGERWILTLQPDPIPVNPYDPEDFRLDLEVTSPDGHVKLIPGFYEQPLTGRDMGDREVLAASAPARFTVRFRPRQSGRHLLRLIVHWRSRPELDAPLPPLVVDGAPWDGYVRVDPRDHRFFSAGGKFVWPLGPNLRSVNDTRSRERLGTHFTPDRGSLTYAAYLRRLAAAGGTGTEIWMSAWNLALEWRADWPGYDGQGRYNQEHAWRLDRVLDLAERLGIHVNLVIDNHGQASTHSDPEWPNNPYSIQAGGRLKDPREVFTDPYARRGQEALRRYIIARYADNPAILGWKLWTEVNLTNEGGDSQALRAWHEQAAARWHALDTYGHPVTTHWCGDYGTPDRSIVALPGLDYICIDAYHGSGRFIASLLFDSTQDPGKGRGLSQFGKPVLVTEFGGNWNGCPLEQLEAENAVGPWAALVSGHAGSPMLWWFEWIDQGNRWQPFMAVSRFLHGEDLRSPRAHSVELAASSPAGQLTGRAWLKPGHLLGYILDTTWGTWGRETPVHDHAKLRIDDIGAQGPLTVRWYNADDGTIIAVSQVNAHGVPFTLEIPPFHHHIALKIIADGAPPKVARQP